MAPYFELCLNYNTVTFYVQTLYVWCNSSFFVQSSRSNGPYQNQWTRWENNLVRCREATYWFWGCAGRLPVCISYCCCSRWIPTPFLLKFSLHCGVSFVEVVVVEIISNRFDSVENIYGKLQYFPNWKISYYSLRV